MKTLFILLVLATVLAYVYCSPVPEEVESEDESAAGIPFSEDFSSRVKRQFGHHHHHHGGYGGYGGGYGGYGGGYGGYGGGYGGYGYGR